MSDEDEQYPSDLRSEEAELGAHGMRIDGEDEEDDLKAVEADEDVDDELI